MLLIRSVIDGRFNHTKLLLQTGRDPNERDKRGRTSLIETCFLKNSKLRMAVLKLLLRFKARVDYVDIQGRNLLSWACYLGLADVVEYITEKCNLHVLGIDRQDSEGNTPFLLSCKSANLRIVKKLTDILTTIRRHDILYKRNSAEVSPLVECFKNGHFEIAKFLVDEANIKIDDLTEYLFQKKGARPEWLDERYYSLKELITEIITNLDTEEDPLPSEKDQLLSEILYLLITNESLRHVALKDRKTARKDSNIATPSLAQPKVKIITPFSQTLSKQISSLSLNLRSSHSMSNLGSSHSMPKLRSSHSMSNLRSSHSMPKLRSSHSTSRLRSSHAAAILGTRSISSPNKGSIKSMLPSLMTLYGEQQIKTSYRSTCSRIGLTRRDTSTLTRDIQREKSALANLPNDKQFNRTEPRLGQTKCVRSSRSNSIQLPQVSAWALLRSKTKNNLQQDQEV